MIFLDRRRDEFWRRVAAQFELWKDLNVLDVCCGFGRWAGVWTPEKYAGVDFSEEMLKLAREKNPGHNFFLGNAKEDPCPKTEFDVIFEVNSLRSLGWSPEQFHERFSGLGSKAVACLEADKFTIYNHYA